MNFLIVFLTVISSVLTVFYIFLKQKFTYWSNRQIDFEIPSFPFGNFTENVLQKKCTGIVLKDIYNKCKGSVIGIYIVHCPVLLIKDLNLIKNILIKDFDHFMGRGMHTDKERDPLSAHLFALPPKEWQPMRQKLSPTFSSGKIKAMFITAINCGENMKKYLNQEIKSGKKLFDMREIFARFTTDIITSVAFGIETDAISNPESIIRQHGSEILKPSVRNNFVFGLSLFAPSLFKIFKMKILLEKVEKYFINLVKETLEYRESNKIIRPDFLQLLIQLRNKGCVKEDENWEIETVDEKFKTMTIEEVAAQCFVFFVAGFDTSSTATTFLLYELAKSTEIQQRVHEDIVSSMKKHENKLTYDSINDMKYLDQCVDEALRKYPPVPFLNRQCIKTYKAYENDLIIEEGTLLTISTLGLHYDPKNFPNPEIFDPERFSIQNKSNRSSMCYLPFGDGPRNCIGLLYVLKIFWVYFDFLLINR